MIVCFFETTVYKDNPPFFKKKTRVTSKMVPVGRTLEKKSVQPTGIFYILEFQNMGIRGQHE